MNPTCPHCHEPAVAVRLDGALCCTECSEAIDPEQVRQMLTAWSRVLEWAADATSVREPIAV